jgi:hypothetical protein
LFVKRSVSPQCLNIHYFFLFSGTICVHFCRYMYHIQYLTTIKIFVIFFKLKLKNNMCMNELNFFRDTVNISLEWVRYCNRKQLTVVSYNLMILDIKVDFYNVYFSLIKQFNYCTHLETGKKYSVTNFFNFFLPTKAELNLVLHHYYSIIL